MSFVRCFLSGSILLCLFDQRPANGQKLRLWYQKPAATWTEALPLGNGRIGAMVYGGIQTDRIQFNVETLWSGFPRPHDRL
ncbi:MAG: hypothetical protein FJX89_04710 [Bacteroidetes bacterium]|nr:hypothetical protein [Bacteroidota bacterium]